MRSQHYICLEALPKADQQLRGTNIDRLKKDYYNASPTFSLGPVDIKKFCKAVVLKYNL